MIKLAKIETTLQVNLEDFYNYVTNMENYINWFPGVIDIKSANDDPHRTLGKKYIEKLIFPEGEAQLTIEVVEAIQNQHFFTEGDFETLLPRMEMRFTPLNENEITFSLSYFSRKRKEELPTELLTVIQNDLATRAREAMDNLKNIKF